MSRAQSWEGFSFRPSLAPACTLPSPLVKIRQAIHKYCVYSCLKRPHHKPRPAATSVSLCAAQQGALDSPRTQLDVACVGGGVLGNPLSRATSVIHFGDVSDMAPPMSSHLEWEGSREEQLISPALLLSRKSHLQPLLRQISVPLKVPCAPPPAADTALVLRASEFATVNVCLWT